MSEPAIGIDLGTSTSIVSVIKDGKPISIPDPVTKTPIVPSIVALNRRNELVVGQAALDSGARPENIVRESKRDIGTDRTYRLGPHSLRPEEVGGLVLRRMKEIAEGYVGQEIKRAVVTVPAYFGDLERRATQNAIRLAGLQEIRLISEPTAAAMAFGINNLSAEENLLVFDMGGGTLDVTVLEMIAGVLDVKGSDGERRLGGTDIDAVVMRWAQEEFLRRHPTAQPSEMALEGLKRKAEVAKKLLSSSFAADVLVENYASVSGTVVDLDLTLDKTQFESLIEPIIQRAISCIDRALQKSNVQKEDIHRCLLVGGSCYIPRVQQAVQDYLGVSKVTGVDPDLAISQGAAVSAGLALHQFDANTGLVVQDVCTHGMGVLVFGTVGTQEMLLYDELIPPSTPIPFFKKEQYQLRFPDQDELDMPVVQAKHLRAQLPEETTPTGAAAVVTDIPHALYGTPHRVEVEFSYDQNHMVQLTASIVGTGKSCTIRLQHQTALMDSEEVGASLGRLDSLWESSPLASRHQSIIRRAEKVLEDRPMNAERIEAALVELKTKISGSDPDGAQAARERLTELLTEV